MASAASVCDEKMALGCERGSAHDVVCTFILLWGGVGGDAIMKARWLFFSFFLAFFFCFTGRGGWSWVG